MVTKEWAAIHRKHHAKCETAEDPHSPQVLGINRVLWGGVFLYVKESYNAETMERYGHGTPDDWMERNLYTRHAILGLTLMGAVNLLLFGLVPGALILMTQIVWIPFWAAGVINGVGHWFGYRNFDVGDASKNIVPWGILIGGEELHNNHHAYGSSAKLSSRWFEVDIGWGYIRILESLRLAKVRKVAPKLRVERTGKPAPDLATLQAVIANRYAVATSYARTLKTACAAELTALRERGGHLADVPSVHRLKRWLSAPDASDLPERERATLAKALEHSKALHTIYAMRQELNTLWERSTESTEQLLHRLQDWCRRAEASGIPPLASFSLQLKRYA
jgi:stearoyl-CoA desaturase (delta-9 desaturase)